MRPLKTLSLLSLSPFCCTGCRNGPIFVQQALRQQCLLPSASPGYPLGSVKRLSSTSSLGHSFAYRVGASFSAKGRRFNPKEDTFSFNPRENTVYTGRPNSGQDAFFVSTTGPADKHGQHGKIALGVADGVGGWADSGIDSADFSHGLCQSLSHIASQSDGSNDPQVLLEQAYDEVVQKGNIVGGGSTACVAVADESGSLSVAK